MVLWTVGLGSEDLAVQPWCVAGVRLMGWGLVFLREGFDLLCSCVVVLPLASPR